jgi:hypothetical protein
VVGSSSNLLDTEERKVHLSLKIQMRKEKETMLLYKIFYGNFPDISLPQRQAIYNLNKRFKRSGGLLDVQSTGKNRLILTKKICPQLHK